MSNQKTLRNELEELVDNMWTRSDYPEGEINALLSTDDNDASDYIQTMYGESLYAFIIDTLDPIENAENFLNRKLTVEEICTLRLHIEDIQESMFIASLARSILDSENTVKALKEAKKAIRARTFKFHIKKDIPIMNYGI